ncbi:MAG TPA: heparinase II/III family protein [Myxococcota bacterium]|nr:heparinase II/III family protein [Myxococcota bacterium]
MRRAELARALRTVRYLRPVQVVGQLRRRLRRVFGAPASEREGPPPALATIQPLVPFLGAPAHAYTDGWRRFRLLNREVTFAGCPDWDFGGEGPLWAYHLHQFDYARRATLPPEARRALMLDWIARHREGVGWESGPISLRAQTWIKLLLEPRALPDDQATRARLAASLASQLTTLSRNLETHLLGNHYLSNLIALVMGGLAFEGPGPNAWLAFERRLREELAEQVLPDGAHVERSPMYHSLLLESVLNLANLATAAARRAPSGLEETLRETAGRMLGALAVWTHPDGEVALFGDCAFGVAHPPAALTSYGAALGIVPRGPKRPGILENAGFVRISSGPFTAITSVSGPMPSYQPGHAHCDALAFELSVGRERLVTDTGVAEYLPGALRDLSRATRSHATVEVNGADQAELWAEHRIGGRPRVVIASAEPGRRLEATCASWSTPNTLHRRVMEAKPGVLEIRDTIEGQSHPVRFSLPFAPGLEPRLERRRARLRLRDGTWIRIDLPEGLHFALERGLYLPEFGRTVERWVLVGRAEQLDRAVLRISVAEVLRHSGSPQASRQSAL